MSFTFKKLAAQIALIVLGFALLTPVLAEPNCDSPSFGELDYCIGKIKQEIDALTPAHENNKKELANLNSQIASLKKRIGVISVELTKLGGEIVQREEDLAYAQAVFNASIAEDYMSKRTQDPLVDVLLSENVADIFREIFYKQKAADERRKLIELYIADLKKLKEDKEALEKNKQSLAQAQTKLDAQAKFLGSEVAKVETYLGTLSAKQNELSALKAGGFQTSVGDVPASAEPCSGKPGSSNFCDPGFRPAFAAFSYGAPHRKGMSQYGAYGRAKAGQSAETILSAYYGGVQLKTDYSTSINITVSGYGAVDIETYVKRIYEMPASWTANDSAALKAQAVAARSYALAYTNNGTRPICATESCQVYKPANKGGAWDAAVDATKGWVLVSGGQPFSSWYASTAGGYTFSYSSQGHTTPNLWDTPGGQGGWPNSAYEISGGSPWFYKGWYKSRSGATCSRSHPWLTSDEMADILNADFVLKGGGGDVARISPVDTGCWGGNPYSLGDLRSIGGYTSVSSVSVVYNNDGSTQQVSFSTNKGSLSLSGADLKKAFNLRAPGYIGIKSSLFNIEKL